MVLPGPGLQFNMEGMEGICSPLPHNFFVRTSRLCHYKAGLKSIPHSALLKICSHVYDIIPWFQHFSFYVFLFFVIWVGSYIDLKFITYCKLPFPEFPLYKTDFCLDYLKILQTLEFRPLVPTFSHYIISPLDSL